MPSEKELVAAVFEIGNKVVMEEQFLPIAVLQGFVCTGEPSTCRKPQHPTMLWHGNASTQLPRVVPMAGEMLRTSHKGI